MILLNLWNTYNAIACGQGNAGCVIVSNLTLEMTSMITMFMVFTGAGVASMPFDYH